MLQKLIALLLNHPQVGPRLVQSLSDSYPIRRAAKFTAYLYLRGKQESISILMNKSTFVIELIMFI